MAVHKAHTFLSGYYFITFTNHRWLPLFELTAAYDLVYSWFDHLRRDGHHIVSYVIMPNHIHFMLAYNASGKSINTLIGNGKRFMAAEIRKRLQQSGQSAILQQHVWPAGIQSMRKGDAIFRDSFDLQHCYSQKYILQKLKYIHDNPCAKKWMLAASPLEFPHSSASFYADGQQKNYPVVSWLTLEAQGWLKKTE